MATVTANTAQAHAPLFDRSPLAGIVAWFAERHRRNTVLRELHQYTGRDLADLGITRGDFTSIAAGTFRR